MGSRVTVADLQEARPDLLATAADDWARQVAEVFDRQVALFAGQVCSPAVTGSWVGGAARAAQARLRRVEAQLSATSERLFRFGVLLREGADSMAGAQAMLRRAFDAAAGCRLTVLADGSVVPAEAEPAVSQAAVREVSALVESALGAAQAAVDRLEPRLRDPFGGGFAGRGGPSAPGGRTRTADAGPSAGAARLPAVPPPGTPPAQVAQWWWSQHPQTQAALLRRNAASLGELDGVPSGVRDAANRVVLAGQISLDTTQLAALGAQEARLEAQVRELTGLAPAGGLEGGALLDPDQVQAAVSLHWAQERLAGLRADLAAAGRRLTALTGLAAKLDEGGKPVAFGGTKAVMPRMLLLDFDTAGPGHAVVACGDPDSARHVVLYVPGMNTRLSDHFDHADITHDQNIALRAEQLAGRGSTASIVWLDYDAPQARLPSLYQVAETSDATAAVPALTRCLTGLRAVNRDLGSLTLLGHSYGSLVVGEAARRRRLPVDDLVLLGSPGVGVRRASELNVARGRVWVGEAGNDPVGRLGWFGQVPAEPEFGANRFLVGRGGSGPFGTGLDAHGQYFDPDSASLSNIAAIVTGRFAQVRLVHGGNVPAPATP